MSRQLRQRAEVIASTALEVFRAVEQDQADRMPRSADLGRIVALAAVVGELTEIVRRLAAEADERHDHTARAINLALGAGR